MKWKGCGRFKQIGAKDGKPEFRVRGSRMLLALELANKPKTERARTQSLVRLGSHENGIWRSCLGRQACTTIKSPCQSGSPSQRTRTEFPPVSSLQPRQALPYSRIQEPGAASREVRTRSSTDYQRVREEYQEAPTSQPVLTPLRVSALHDWKALMTFT